VKNKTSQVYDYHRNTWGSSPQGRWKRFRSLNTS